jgi:hypothetical protein
MFSFSRRLISIIGAQTKYLVISFYFRFTTHRSRRRIYNVEHEIWHDALICTEYCHFGNSLTPTKTGLVLSEEVADRLAIRRA